MNRRTITSPSSKFCDAAVASQNYGFFGTERWASTRITYLLLHVNQCFHKIDSWDAPIQNHPRRIFWNVLGNSVPCIVLDGTFGSGRDVQNAQHNAPYCHAATTVEREMENCHLHQYGRRSFSSCQIPALSRLMHGLNFQKNLIHYLSSFTERLLTKIIEGCKKNPLFAFIHQNVFANCYWRSNVTFAIMPYLEPCFLHSFIKHHNKSLQQEWRRWKRFRHYITYQWAPGQKREDHTVVLSQKIFMVTYLSVLCPFRNRFSTAGSVLSNKKLFSLLKTGIRFDGIEESIFFSQNEDFLFQYLLNFYRWQRPSLPPWHWQHLPPRPSKTIETSG